MHEPHRDDEPAGAEAAITATRAWVRRAVIGLNLCPFAKAPEAKGRIRYAVSRASSTDALLGDLAAEIDRLRSVDEREIETTLLIHPHVLTDFGDYNDFLSAAEELLTAKDPDGELQVASFHPDYRFAGTAPDDLGNATNRSPYPTLHLLRESSVDRAVLAFPAAETIYEANIATLEHLGAAGWAALRSACRDDAARDLGEARDGAAARWH